MDHFNKAKKAVEQNLAVQKEKWEQKEEEERKLVEERTNEIVLITQENFTAQIDLAESGIKKRVKADITKLSANISKID